MRISVAKGPLKNYLGRRSVKPLDEKNSVMPEIKDDPPCTLEDANRCLERMRQVFKDKGWEDDEEEAE